MHNLPALCKHRHRAGVVLWHKRLGLCSRPERVTDQFPVNVGVPLVPDRLVRLDRHDLAGHLTDGPPGSVGDHDHVNRLAHVLGQDVSLPAVDRARNDVDGVGLLTLLESRLSPYDLLLAV